MNGAFNSPSVALGALVVLAIGLVVGVLWKGVRDAQAVDSNAARGAEVVDRATDHSADAAYPAFSESTGVRVPR